MIKRILLLLFLISITLFSLGCNKKDSPPECSKDNPKEDNLEVTMGFSFELLQDISLIDGSSYFMDFGELNSQEDAAIAEGKLLSAFGDPLFTSENYENSFEYIIRATDEKGESVVFSVYGMGIVSIGADRQDDFAKKAASALIEYVNTFAPADYSRTVYYLDFNMQLDIKVKNGKAVIVQSQISKEKMIELINKWYK